MKLKTKLITTKLITSATLLSLSFGLNTVSYAFGTADTIDQSPYAEPFKALDTDHDGTLTKHEASKDAALAKGHFAKADKDNDGTLTLDEFAEYKTQQGQKTVKKFASDAEITTVVKSKILKEEGLKGFKVSVETHDGIVQLSGFVNDKTLVERAGELAKSVDGVKSVKNDLIVKS